MTHFGLKGTLVEYLKESKSHPGALSERVVIGANRSHDLVDYAELGKKSIVKA